MANSVRLVYQLQLIGIDFPDPYAEKDCLAPFSLRKEGESCMMFISFRSGRSESRAHSHRSCSYEMHGIYNSWGNEKNI